jgi:F-type H+-transporting ATPase subunit gamma
MIQSLRQIRRRIKSVESTQKLTRAMEMISVAKLRSAQNRLNIFKNYFYALDGILRDSIGCLAPGDHQLLTRGKSKKICLCVIAADTGLCGVYNNGVLKAAADFLSRHKNKEVTAVCVGKKALQFMEKRAIPVEGSFISLNGRYSHAAADSITQALIKIFSSGRAGEVYAAYTVFESGSHHKPVVEKILNIEMPPAQQKVFFVEPSVNELIDAFVPVYTAARLRFILLNAFACEHSARAIAMGEATDNAAELLENLVLVRNKVRQANITREIIEVISSSEALKG